jgi:hypothetical protein
MVNVDVLRGSVEGLPAITAALLAFVGALAIIKPAQPMLPGFEAGKPQSSIPIDNTSDLARFTPLAAKRIRALAEERGVPIKVAISLIMSEDVEAGAEDRKQAYSR